MKVVFFVQYFFPSSEIGAKRPSKLAQYLLAQRHTVEVICAATPDPRHERASHILGTAPTYQIEVPRDLISLLWARLKSIKAFFRSPTHTQAESVNDHKNDSPAAAKNSTTDSVQFLKRWFFSMESLYCGLKAWTVICIPKVWRYLRNSTADIIVTSCPPMNTALAIRLVRPFVARKFRWVIDLRDPFCTPTLPTNTTWLRTRLEHAAERTCLSSCNLIVVATPSLGNDIARRIPHVAHKIRVIYNGYDGVEKTSSGAVEESCRTLKLLSTGTIYFKRDPRPLFDAMKLAVQRNHFPEDAFHLTLLGNCENPSRAVIQQWIRDRNIEHMVSLVDAVPAAQVDEYVQRATILINFAQEQEMLIPAKTYDYMASGKESLTITEPDSETAKVVRQTNCGPTVSADRESLAEALTGLYRHYIVERGSFTPNKTAIREFSRDQQNKNMLLLLEQLLTNTEIQAL